MTILSQYLNYLKHFLFEILNYCQYTKNNYYIAFIIILHNI